MLLTSSVSGFTVVANGCLYLWQEDEKVTDRVACPTTDNPDAQASHQSILTPLTSQLGPWMPGSAYPLLSGSSRRPSFEYQQRQGGRQRKPAKHRKFYTVTAAG